MGFSLKAKRLLRFDILHLDRSSYRKLSPWLAKWCNFSSLSEPETSPIWEVSGSKGPDTPYLRTPVKGWFLEPESLN